MSASAVVQDILRRSGLTKTAMSSRADISRSLFDGYLNGDRQPSVPQIERLADAAGLRLDMRLVPKPHPISAEYVAVMDMAGRLAGKRQTQPPLEYPYGVWRRPHALAR